MARFAVALLVALAQLATAAARSQYLGPRAGS